MPWVETRRAALETRRVALAAVVNDAVMDECCMQCPMSERHRRPNSTKVLQLALLLAVLGCLCDGTRGAHRHAVVGTPRVTTARTRPCALTSDQRQP